MRISDWSSDVCSSDLDLTDITLFSDDGDESLTMQRLSLGFSPFRLITGDMLPERLEVSGLTLDIEQGDDGSWSFAGFPTGASELSQAKRDALAKQIAGFGPLVVQNCTLAFSGKARSEEHTSELQSLMRISYAVFCL